MSHKTLPLEGTYTSMPSGPSGSGPMTFEQAADYLLSAPQNIAKSILYGQTAFQQSIYKTYADSTEAMLVQVEKNITTALESVTNNDWLINEVLPLTQAPPGDRIVVRELIYDAQVLDEVPELAVPRVLTQRVREYTAGMNRRGIGLYIVEEYAMTPEGIQNYFKQVKQIADSVSQTLYIEAINALLNCNSVNPTAGNLFGITGNNPTREDILNAEAEMFGILTKVPHGGEQIVKFANRIMQNRNGIKPNALILPSNAMSYMGTRPEAREAKLYGTSYSPFGDTTGLSIYNMRTICTDPATATYEDLLERVRVVGEWFPNIHEVCCPNVKPKDYTHADRDTYLFDWETDTIRPVTFKEIFLKSGLFDNNFTQLENAGKAFFSGWTNDFDGALDYIVSSGMGHLVLDGVRARQSVTAASSSVEIADFSGDRFTVMARNLKEHASSLGITNTSTSLTNRLVSALQDVSLDKSVTDHAVKFAALGTVIAMIERDENILNEVKTAVTNAGGKSKEDQLKIVGKVFVDAHNRVLKKSSLADTASSSGKQKDDLKTAIEALNGKKSPGNIANVFGLLFNNNVPIPLSFIIARPEIRLEMGSAIATVKGMAGRTYIGNSDMSGGRDAARKTIQMSYTARMASVVHDPSMVVTIHSALPSSYKGGGGVSFNDPRDSNNVQAYQRGVRNHSLFSFAISPAERMKSSWIDITGSFPEHLPNGIDNSPHFSSAEIYQSIWGFTGFNGFLNASYAPVPEAALTNTILGLGTCFFTLHNNGNRIPLGLKISGQNHFGSYQYPGFKKDFLGRGSGYVQKTNPGATTTEATM